MEHDFNFTMTGIGSVPFLEIRDSCAEIQRLFPDMPFWPQFVKRSLYEDMIIQFSEGLPFLKIIKEKRSLVAERGDNFEKGLLGFYENFLSDKLEPFSISYEFAPGLYEMLELCEGSNARFIKGQSVGPITFAASINDEEGRAIINDTELMDVYTKGIAIKGLWQVKKLKESGKLPVIFFDEPYLSSVGSAFSTVSRDQVVNALKEVVEYIKERENVLIGIHCCGNTDWSMIIEVGPDIINFDAFNYIEHFFLYKDMILNFIRGGGVLAWGIVPTTDADFEHGGEEESLFLKLKDAILEMNKWGLDLELIRKNSLLTPSCGMGTMQEGNAKRVLLLLSNLSKRLSLAFDLKKV